MSRSFECPKTERVVYGVDATNDLLGYLRSLGVARPFIVASHTLATTTEVVDRLAGLSNAVGTYHAVPAHVPREAVLEVAERCRDAGADGVVSIGGGSPIDCAKLAALCLSEGIMNASGLERQRVKYQHPGPPEIPSHGGTLVPHVAVPTTLSGGEFTRIAGSVDGTRGVKDIFQADGMTPRIVILDPAIARHTPEWLWLASGMRAIDHIIEGVCSLRSTTLTDAVLLRALRTFVDDLLLSAADPDDLGSRERCQVAAWMAIMFLQNVGTGLSHALGHQLGAQFRIPHGVTSCILLPPVMNFNRPVTASSQAKLAEAFGIDIRGLEDEEAAEAAEQELRRLLAATGLPTRLRDVEVSREHFGGLIENILEDMVVGGNPRPVTGADIRSVLEAAY